MARPHPPFSFAPSARQYRLSRLSHVVIRAPTRPPTLYGPLARIPRANLTQPSKPNTEPPPPQPTPTPPPPPAPPQAPLPPPMRDALLISVVPFLWGSYGIAAKCLLTQPTPMPFSLLNLSSFLIAFISLLPATPPKPRSANLRSTLLNGAELGFYLYIGTLFNLAALDQTSPTRAAFFLQLTTVFVPIAGAILGDPFPPQLLAACILAMTGTTVLANNADQTLSIHPATPMAALNQGDCFAIAAAVVYSLHVLRLARVKQPAGPVILVQGKVLMQTTLSFATVLYAVWNGDESVRGYLHSFPLLPWSQQATAIALSAWLGAGSTALATWAQVVGQKRVGASRAAVFYATQPVWAAALAWAVGLDRLTGMEVVGGGLIVAAGGLLAVVDRRTR